MTKEERRRRYRSPEGRARLLARKVARAPFRKGRDEEFAAHFGQMTAGQRARLRRIAADYQALKAEILANAMEDDLGIADEFGSITSCLNPDYVRGLMSSVEESDRG
jgi:hypothetical protein